MKYFWAMLMLVFSLTNLALAAPSLFISPDVALPGDAVRVSGYGWDNSARTLVIFNDDELEIKLARANYIDVCPKTLGGQGCEKGEIGYSLTIPTNLKTGDYFLGIISDKNRATASFQVLAKKIIKTSKPKIILDSTSGKAGSRVVVSGGGFTPKSGLILKFGKDLIRLGRGFGLDTDSNGRFSTIVTIPANSKPGRYIIEVNNGDKESAFANFIVVGEEGEKPEQKLEPKPEPKPEEKPKQGDFPTPRYGNIPAPKYEEVAAPKYGEISTPKYGDIPTTKYGEIQMRKYDMVPLSSQVKSNLSKNAKKIPPEVPGTYRCRQYNISGGGGSCKNHQPLIINKDGTYTFSSERGIVEINGVNMKLSASKLRGIGKISQGEGEITITFNYKYKGWDHTLVYSRPFESSSVKKPEAKQNTPISKQLPATINLKLIIKFPEGNRSAEWLNSILLWPKGDKTQERQKLAVATDKQTIIVTFWDTPRDKYWVMGSAGFEPEKLGEIDISNATGDLTVELP